LGVPYRPRLGDQGRGRVGAIRIPVDQMSRTLQGTTTGRRKGVVVTINFSAEITAKLVDYTGSDRKIAAAARVSTLGDLSEHRAEDSAKDKGLIRYLMRERHGSPFEHTSMTFLVRAPIFVAREF